MVVVVLMVVLLVLVVRLGDGGTAPGLLIRATIVKVVFFFDEPLVEWRVGSRDLVVEQAGEDEGDGRATRGADIGQDGLQTGDGHSDDIAQDDDGRRDDREPGIAHLRVVFFGRGQQRRVARRTGVQRAGRRRGRSQFRFELVAWSPFKHGVEAGAARVHLQWIGEHDQDDNRRSAHRGGDRWRILRDDIAPDLVAKGEIAGDGNEDIDGPCRADGGQDDRAGMKVRVVGDLVEDAKHVLMARVGEHDDGERGQRGNSTGPGEDAQGRRIVAIGQRVMRGEVVHDQDDKVADRDERDDRGVFERVEPAQKRERNDHQHKGGHPEVSVDQKTRETVLVGEAEDNAGHQITNDDQIADTHPEALDGDGRVENDRRVRVCDLRQRKEAGRSTVQVGRATCLQV